MVEQDTIKLLRECDAGIKMGIASIEDVLPYVHSSTLEKQLTETEVARREVSIGCAAVTPTLKCAFGIL